MAEQGLDSPIIIVNGDAVYIEPNSFKYKLGLGEININVQSSGASTEIVKSINPESKKSSVEFVMKATTKNFDKILAWHQNSRTTGGNTIVSNSGSGSTPISFQNMFITSEPEYSPGSDGKVTVTFEGKAVTPSK